MFKCTLILLKLHHIKKQIYNIFGPFELKEEKTSLVRDLKLLQCQFNVFILKI